MRLVDHLRVVMDLIDKYGRDAVILKCDLEAGPIEFDAPSEARRIDGEIVLEYEFKGSLSTLATKDEMIASLNEAWDRLPLNLQEAWGSQDKMDAMFMNGIRRAENIVSKWSTSEVVIVT